MIDDTTMASDPRSGEGGLAALGDTLGELVAGIPAPVRKNAAKAFGRLCTAAVEYPVALIENAIAERRAESQARIELINTSARQMAEQLQTNPEYARAAATKFAHKILRERVNVDQISNVAAAELKSDPPVISNEEVPDSSPIQEDWLNAFEVEAAQMSSEHMQRLFGKILAGEIRRPASYSIKTIKIMAQLDNKAAELFALLCSLSVSLKIPMSNVYLDARVIGMGNAGTNSLLQYGLSFGNLNILQEYGLIISDYNSYMDFQVSVAKNNKVTLPIDYQNAQWALIPKASPHEGVLNIHGVAFSRSGRELLSVVEVKPNEEYTSGLTHFLDQQGFIFTKI